MLNYTGALLLVIFSYALPYTVFPFHQNRKIIISFYLVTSAHHIVSFTNYFILTLPGAGMDANTFHMFAMSSVEDGDIPGFSVGSGIYGIILSVSYHLFGANKLVGQSVSVVVAVLSLLFITKIAQHIKIDKNNITFVILAVGLTPSFLYFTSLTLREVFQVFGLVGGVLFTLEAITLKSRLKMLTSSFFFIFMGLFHHVLLALSFLLITLSLISYFIFTGASVKKIFSNALVSIIVIATLGYISVVHVPAGRGNDYIKILKESDGIINMIDRYRSSIHGARSSYEYEVDAASSVKMSAGLVHSYIHYLFGPNISSLTKPIDIIPFVNSVGRLLIIVFIIFFILKKNQLPSGSVYLLLIYFLLTSMWSLGTTNYGQAFRHNSITDWILVVLLTIGIQEVFSPKNRAKIQT